MKRRGRKKGSTIGRKTKLTAKKEKRRKERTLFSKVVTIEAIKGSNNRREGKRGRRGFTWSMMSTLVSTPMVLRPSGSTLRAILRPSLFTAVC
jgi:hypothetical protein